jgi:uncharacterized membrane protein
MKLKEKLTGLGIWEYMGLILFLVSIIGVIYFNLSDNRLSLDPDYAITIYHGREMVKNGTLVLDNWKPTTSMEFDNSLLFAVPLYAITGNMFLSVGISNLIIVCLFVFSIWTIFEILGTGLGVRFWVLAVMLTPYSYEWLDYFKMLFFAHANYGVKALVPILLVLNILTFSGKEDLCKIAGWKKNFFFALYVIILFITCASTGTYTFICGVAPIFMMQVIALWREADNVRLRTEWPVWAGTFAASLIGMLVYKKIYNSTSPVAGLIKAEDFADNFRSVLVGIYQTFGALMNDDIPAFSVTGIYYCLKIAFVTIIIFVTVAVFVKWFKRTPGYENFVLFAVVYPFNMLILILGDLRGGNSYIPYRYLLIGAPILLVALGTQLEKWLGGLKKQQVLSFMICVCLATGFMLVGNIKITKENMMNKDYVVEMTDYFKTMDVESVFIMNDKDTALMCKAVDDSKKYACYMTETGTFPLEYNYYYDELNFDYYGDKNAIAIPNYSALTDYVSEEVAARYTYVGEVRWLATYVSDTNPFK